MQHILITDISVCRHKHAPRRCILCATSHPGSKRHMIMHARYRTYNGGHCLHGAMCAKKLSGQFAHHVGGLYGPSSQLGEHRGNGGARLGL